MAKFFYDINHFEGTPLELAAYTHLQIAKVHPFLDGNGRLARLMLNFQLVKAGYLPISLPSKYREQYFNCLEEFKVNKNGKLISVVGSHFSNTVTTKIVLYSIITS